METAFRVSFRSAIPFSSSSSNSSSPASTASSVSGASASSQCIDSSLSQSQLSLRLSPTDKEALRYQNVECRRTCDDDDDEDGGENDIDHSRKARSDNCQHEDTIGEAVNDGTGATADELSSENKPVVSSNAADNAPVPHVASTNQQCHSRTQPSLSSSSSLLTPPSPTAAVHSHHPSNGGNNACGRTEAQASSHRRHESLYDGSDYGNDSDFEDPGDFTPGFDKCMASIDKLCRWSITDQVTGGEEVIARVTDSLHQLNNGADPQGMVESCATRLITMHTSFQCHLYHQSRVFQSVTAPFDRVYLSTLHPGAIEVISNDIDDLYIAFLKFAATPYTSADRSSSSSSSTSSSSFSSGDPLQLLVSFTSQTSDLIIDLHVINKSIQEFRRLSTLASRRLASASNELSFILDEEQSRNRACRLLEGEDWDRRLEQREAGRTCQDVIDGFERYYEELRARLLGGHGIGTECEG